MPITLTEGQADRADHTDLVYPEINTCMTLTLVYKNPDVLVGGHFSCPVKGMTYVAPKTILDKMKSDLPPGGSLQKIFLIGAWEVWDSGSGKPIKDFAGELDEDFDKAVVYDTTSWKTVNITFEANGAITIVPTSKGLQGTNASKKPTKWKD